MFSFSPLFFPRFFSIATFSHRRSAWIKKLIYQKLTGTPKNLKVDTFPDPVGHFGAHWRPFWILQAVRCCRRWASAPGAARLVFVFQFLVTVAVMPSDINLCYHFGGAGCLPPLSDRVKPRFHGSFLPKAFHYQVYVYIVVKYHRESNDEYNQ